MTDTIKQALALWGFDGAPFTLIATCENAVYRVDTSRGPVALRVPRKGYRTDAELHSELMWMAALAKGGLSVPAPMPATDFATLHIMNGTQIDVFSWLGGDTLGAVSTALCDQLGTPGCHLRRLEYLAPKRRR